MTSLSAYAAQPRAKILVLGHSGAGKTCLPISLLRAGYHLAIMDTDDKVYPLAQMAVDRGLQHEMETLVDVQTVAQEYRLVGDVLAASGKPAIWPQLQSLATTWPGFGPITSFDNDTVLLVDALSTTSDAAMDFQRYISGGAATDAYGQTIGKAQDSLRFFLQTLTGGHLRCNIVVNAHMELLISVEHGMKYQPLAPGKKLSPRIAQFFDYVVLLEPAPGTNGARPSYWCHTTPRRDVDLKVPRGWATPPAIPSDLALAYLLELARGRPGPSGRSAVADGGARFWS